MIKINKAACVGGGVIGGDAIARHFLTWFGPCLQCP